MLITKLTGTTHLRKILEDDIDASRPDLQVHGGDFEGHAWDQLHSQPSSSNIGLIQDIILEVTIFSSTTPRTPLFKMKFLMHTCTFEYFGDDKYS